MQVWIVDKARAGMPPEESPTRAELLTSPLGVARQNGARRISCAMKPFPAEGCFRHNARSTIRFAILGLCGLALWLADAIKTH